MGLTQADVAFLLGFKTTTTVSKHELAKRRPSSKTALAYALIYGVSVKDIFGGEFIRMEPEINRRTETLIKKIKSTEKQSVKRQYRLSKLEWMLRGGFR